MDTYILCGLLKGMITEIDGTPDFGPQLKTLKKIVAELSLESAVWLAPLSRVKKMFDECRNKSEIAWKLNFEDVAVHGCQR